MRTAEPPCLDPTAPAQEASGLDAAALARFRRDGFVVRPGLAEADEIATLRGAYDRLFERRAGWERGDFFDMLAHEEQGATPEFRLPQLAWPSRHEPALAATPLRRATLDLARRILGPRAELVWEFAICKPARVGAATPWHQDEASFTVGTPYRTALSVWIPLQDTDPDNGCLLYVPGSHEGPLLPHESVDGIRRRAHALRAVVQAAELEARAVAVPLRAGDAVLHHSRTLHGAGPNLSGGPRRSLTLEFAVKSQAELMRQDFPWNRGKRTGRDEREWRAMPLRERLLTRLRQGRVRLGF
jgi:ectoine hydroxylase-related dioxygenase (phytanoyl-CoA dioxygenase family)